MDLLNILAANNIKFKVINFLVICFLGTTVVHMHMQNVTKWTWQKNRARCLLQIAGWIHIITMASIYPHIILEASSLQDSSIEELSRVISIFDKEMLNHIQHFSICNT
ncbi:hypothetical protein ACJX0J_019159 [Zea mays]